MKIFISGATGYLGNLLAHRLAGNGHLLHVLLRDPRRQALVSHRNIRVFFGDLNNEKELAAAMQDCRQMYHLAGQVKPWLRDPGDFYRVNVEGTAKICDQALAAGVEKLVFTSTAAVLGSTTGLPLDEQAPPPGNSTLDYDRSKLLAEQVVLEYVSKGLNAVIVRPTKVFGPGNSYHSLTANAVIRNFLRKNRVFIPAPGTYRVSFAYTEDVVTGHILAMEHGVNGEDYILGGHNITFYEFFDRIRKRAGIKGLIVNVPKGVARIAGRCQELRWKITGAPVLFPARAAGYAYRHFSFSSHKAIQKLGYSIAPLDDSIDKTIAFIKK